MQETDVTDLPGSVAVAVDIVNRYGSGATYALGALVGSTATYSQTDGQGGRIVTTTNTIGWYDAAATTSMRVETDYTGTSPATPDTDYRTDYAFTATGTLATATIADGRPRRVSVRSDALGQIVRRDEQVRTGVTYADSAGGDPHALWYRFDGREIGTVGNNGATMRIRSRRAAGAVKPTWHATTSDDRRCG